MYKGVVAMSEFFMIMFIVIAIVMIILIMYSFSKNSGKEKETVNLEHQSDEIHYFKKPFMTYKEKDLFDKMKPLELELNIHIQPQVSLASVIRKESHQKFQNELNRIVDFAVFNEDYTELLFLIELNDPTHNQEDRKRRDRKVHFICNQVGIKIMTFYTYKANETVWVQNRIRDELRSKSIQEEKPKND